MTSMKALIRFAAIAALALVVAVPTFAAARGSANFSQLVVLGDSYGAGVESGSLNQNHQQYSWGAQLARQVGATNFVQPLVSFPGIGAELQINDIVAYPPVILPAAGQGQPLLLNYPAPYNNLSIPGATVADLTTLTGKEAPTSTAKAFAQFILRGQGTAVQQAIALHPTFIAIWIGGNDLLGAVLAGTPAALTPTDKFKADYEKMLDQLIAGAPNAGIVVGNLPTAANALPILTTVPPVLVNPLTRQPVLLPNGQPIYFVADLGGGNIGQLPQGSAVLLPCSAQIATGFGIPGALAADPRFANLPNIGKPLPDSCVLTPTESAAIVTRANEFNKVIEDAAAARNIPVADIKGLFDRIATQGGMNVGPFNLNASYITGGLFSLDGFHMTDIGYMFFANQYIRTINAAYGTDIPLASITRFFQNNGGVFYGSTTSGQVWVEGMPWSVSDEAAQSMTEFASPVQHKKLRAVAH